MKNLINDLKNQYKSSFKSQDSKYFLITASKVTFVPLLSFGVLFYSFWTILEMNFSFFAANGFLTGEDNKSTFFDIVLMNISDYFLYFTFIMMGVFLVGLLTSYFALRSFSEIQSHILKLEDDVNAQFVTKGISKSKLINQVSNILFKYIQLYAKHKKKPNFKLPKNLEILSSPPIDKVFFIQYISLVGIICLVTNVVLFSFTHELYQEIVAAGIRLLPGNQVVANYLVAQEGILFNVYGIAIFMNITLYLAISQNIIRTVDGVSYGFARDMLQIIEGNHELRLRPRNADPGKEIAINLNLLLDEYFYEETLDQIAEQEDFEQEDTTHNLHNNIRKTPQLQSIDDLNTQKINELDESFDNEELEIEQDDLPPAFIEEKMVVGGEKVFNITTPDGMKLGGLNEETALKLVEDIQKKSK